MFEAGEKVIYPLHGAGFIEEIEESTEKSGGYYIIRIPTGNVRIRIPKGRAKEAGMRYPVEKELVEETIIRVGRSGTATSDNWNQRYKENLQRLRTGELQEAAEVVKMLKEQEQKKKLSSIESRLFSMARQIVLSEIISVYEIDKEKAEELLAKWLKNC